MTKDHLETPMSEIKGLFGPGSLMHRHTCEDCIGRAMCVFCIFSNWVARPINTVEPATFGLIPKSIVQIGKAMLHGLVQTTIAWVKPNRFSGKASMPRLKFQQLLVRTNWIPTIIEIAEKTSILSIQRAGKPHIYDVASESGL